MLPLLLFGGVSFERKASSSVRGDANNSQMTREKKGRKCWEGLDFFFRSVCEKKTRQEFGNSVQHGDWDVRTQQKDVISKPFYRRMHLARMSNATNRWETFRNTAKKTIVCKPQNYPGQSTAVIWRRARIRKISFSYTVNGELNSFGAPVQGVVGLRVALAHRLRPCQRFWTRGPDAVYTAHREPPNAGALVSSHQFAVKPANIVQRTQRNDRAGNEEKLTWNT